MSTKLVLLLALILVFVIPVSATVNHETFHTAEPSHLLNLNTNYTYTPEYTSQSAVRAYCNAHYGASYDTVNDNSYVQWFSPGYFHNSTYYNLSGGGTHSYTSYTINTSTFTTIVSATKCIDVGASNAYYDYYYWDNRIDQLTYYYQPIDVDYTNFTCNGLAYSASTCKIPAHIKIYDDTTGSPTSWNWTFNYHDVGSILYSEYQNQDFTTNLTGTVYASHCADNGIANGCVGFIFWTSQNTTLPYINITANITAPNFTPIIPTLPLTIAPLPDQLNRSHVRDLINTSVFGNVSADYLTYWDDFYSGMMEMIQNVLDTIFFPVTQLTEWMSTPSAWIIDLATQYSAKSDTIVYLMLSGVYAFPPKLLNLVTYSLCLDFVLVLMHEFGGKK